MGVPDGTERKWFGERGDVIKDQNQVGVCGEVNGEKEWEKNEKERKTGRTGKHIELPLDSAWVEWVRQGNRTGR